MTKEEIQKNSEHWYNKYKELEKENERLKGDLELWESGGCRATNLFECGVVKELKEQLTKAKEILEELAKMEYVINPPVDKVRSLMVKAEQFLEKVK